ncbi:MAG: DAK2 domain-containing protein, partial [Coriobacteriales bacterium]|nr:DAK2 domain-containing protein [Coriobacteriales bacterium]
MATVDPLSLVSAASEALKSRADEVNRLNVFPVPDGDTGTNMSLTMEAVVTDVRALGPGASTADFCKAITHGSLMGARGNSGVILSQILRGLCEVGGAADAFDTEALAAAFERSVTVAYQAVRKPVEGTILTVLRDSAEEARRAAEEGAELEVALERVVAESFESVKRTPDLLETLRVNGVVDAGGYGLAILFEGFVAALAGHEVRLADVSSQAAPLLHVAPVEDWEDEEYLYCTEFLLHGESLDEDEVKRFVSSMGGSELVVGDPSVLKIHVHTDEPGTVLSHMTGIGQVSEVHINNMRLQQQARDEALRAEAAPAKTRSKPIGFVTVASGKGLKEILHSLGADVIVNGGQTMNPATRDLLEAIESVDAQRV